VKITRSVAHIALVLLLLFSQQLGIAHAVSHLSPEKTSSTTNDKRLPAELQCDQCLAFAAIGSALGASQHAFFCAMQAEGMAIPNTASALLSTKHRAFDSRAPPVTR
jgi:hypothetical protein